MSPHVARLRAAVGHELIVLPSVAVLPVDESGSLLLATQIGHDDGWHVVGGAVDPGESPAEAAMRECLEEIGVPVRLTGLLGAFGGPDYEVTYPNGDRVAYVTVVYTARSSRACQRPTARNWDGSAGSGRRRCARRR